jgi:peptidyl-prolyl cis-trans isomerase C
MSKRTNLFVVGTLAMLIGFAAHAQDVTRETIVTTVNGQAITIGHMIVLRESLPEQYLSLPDDVLFDGLLEQLEHQTVLAQKAGEPNVMIRLRLENEERSMLAGSIIQELLANALTEEALQTAYDARFKSADLSREFNASHILVESEQEAAALVEALIGGADFAQLARDNSTGPSGPNGGELGWFGPGMMVAPFEEAVLTMEPGQVSAPVQTQFGWHVIKMNETRIKDAPSFEDVRADLSEEIQTLLVETTLTTLTDSAEIERPDLSAIDRSVIRNLGLVTE